MNEDPAHYELLKRRIGQLLPNFTMRTFFDVGANVGQTAVSVRHNFPEAAILAFEPIKATFEQLSGNFTGDASFRCWNLAFGVADGEATMIAKGTGVLNRIVPSGAEAKKNTTVVPVRSGDSFCAETGVPEISYLKIDTEGHDFEVLRGFAGMLARQAVELLEVEAGLHPGNTRHVPFERFKAHLEPLGYLLFMLREPTSEYVGRPNLRRCNMVFASTQVLDANPRAPKAKA
jgi:FkbM family methyltransferase